MHDLAKLYRLARLQDDGNTTTVHADLDKMVDIIDAIFEAHVPSDYKEWRGIRGVKRLRKDIPTESHPELVEALCPDHKHNLVLTPKVL